MEVCHVLYPPPGKLSSGQAFVWMDRCVDTTRKGPMFLRLDAVAQIVKDSLQKGERLGHYKLHAWVLMANHVHVLLTPQIEPIRFIKSLKDCTARAANKVLHRTGEPFWQGESLQSLGAKAMKNFSASRRISKLIR